jgi:hypothetical protein
MKAVIVLALMTQAPIPSGPYRFAHADYQWTDGARRREIAVRVLTPAPSDSRMRPIIAKQFEITHLAAVGHSLGGFAAVRACQQDARIRACVNEDGGTADGVFLRYPGPCLQNSRCCTSKEACRLPRINSSRRMGLRVRSGTDGWAVW